MAPFKNAKELYSCIGGLFDWAKNDREVAPKLAATGLTIRLNYTDPEASIYIDCRDGVDWKPDEKKAAAEVEFFMTADVGHRFWLGKVNLLIALMKRDITATGPIPKIMKILPILKPLYAEYPKVLEKKGRKDLAGA